MKNLRLALLATTLIASIAGAAVAQSNPSQADTQAARSRRICADPWVTIALETVFYRVPTSACDINLYNNGRWNSYAELLRAVRSTYRPVPIEGSGPLAGKLALGIFSGASLVAAGGGNMVAAGGGNLVTAGGSNMVAAGGGNIIMLDNNRLISPGGGSYGLQSTRGKPVPVRN